MIFKGKKIHASSVFEEIKTKKTLPPSSVFEEIKNKIKKPASLICFFLQKVLENLMIFFALFSLNLLYTEIGTSLLTLYMLELSADNTLQIDWIKPDQT